MLSVLVLTIMLSLVNLNAMAAEASIKIEKSNYGPYAEITVNFTGVSEEMAANGVWVGVAEKKGNFLKASEYWTYLTTSAIEAPRYMTFELPSFTFFIAFSIYRDT